MKNLMKMQICIMLVVNVDDLLEGAKRDRICKIAIFDTEDAQINTYMHVKHLNDSFKVSLSGHQWR